MADLINIMYGKASCYGVVSLLKAVKNGINTFLEGFLKEENIRFRDYKIKFEIRPPIVTQEQLSLIKWPEFKKKLGKFSMFAPL